MINESRSIKETRGGVENAKYQRNNGYCTICAVSQIFFFQISYSDAPHDRRKGVVPTPPG